MRKKYIALALAVIVVMMAAVGVSLAYTQISGSPVNTQISTKSLSISLNSVQTPQTKAVTYDKLVPGDQIDLNFTVSNSENTTLYTRVTINKSWGDMNDAYAKDFEADGSLITLSTDKMNGWIVAYEDDEQLVLYYTKPLAAGESTSGILSGIGLSKNANNNYADKSVKLSVTADAVQSMGAETAMKSAWGVAAIFADDGSLTSVTE